MSTRSIIGILNKDATATYVFCHWDGYPRHHGPILMEHYATEDRVRQLLAQGQIEVLEKYISPEEVPGGIEPAYPTFGDYSPGWKHSGQTRAKDVCEFGLRDNNTEHMSDADREIYKSVTAPLTEFGDRWGGQCYDYLFKNGAWYWRESCYWRECGNAGDKDSTPRKRWKKLTKKHFDIN